jgi:hypothetical protein
MAMQQIKETRKEVYVVRDVDRNTTVGVYTSKKMVREGIKTYLKDYGSDLVLNKFRDELEELLRELFKYGNTEDSWEYFSIETFIINQ